VTPPDIVSHHLNHAGQNVLTIASWVIAAGVLVLAGWLSRRAKHPIFVCMVLASGVAALAEPLYDVMFSLYFYSGHGMQKTYTVFDIPQPVWAYSGYAILYGLPAMFIVKEIGEGKMTPTRLWAWAGVELLESCVFEIAGINLGTYTYWGPHVFRIWHYRSSSRAGGRAGHVLRGGLREPALPDDRDVAERGRPGDLPVTMLGANFGAGWAVIVAIHAHEANVWWVRAATLVSIATAALLVRLVIALIPPPGNAADLPRAEPAGRVLAHN